MVSTPPSPSPEGAGSTGLLPIVKALATPGDLDGLLARIVREAAGALHADRGTLFLRDRARDELWSRIALGLEAGEIRLKSTQGVAGFVATTGQRLALADAYGDPRFDPEADRRTGYRTRSVAAAPLRARDGGVLGVLEVLKKAGGPFTPADEDYLEVLASCAAVALEQARLAEEAQRAAGALKQVEEMKANFLATVSHELRSPLAPIVGYLQLFLSEAPGPLTARQRQALDVMLESARRLQGLIDDLLTFLQLERGEVGLNRQRVVLGALLAEQAQGLRGAAVQKGVELAVEVVPGLPAVVADPRVLARAIALLLDNAVKFTPAGGRVTLSAAPAAGAWADRRSGPERAAHRPGARDAVRVAVSDTGIGIPPEHVPRIFDQFYQVDSSATRAFGGAGHGLTLVRRIIEAHGSQVAVESQVGVGSTFAFLLPTA